jgi:hypothetical protein
MPGITAIAEMMGYLGIKVIAITETQEHLVEDDSIELENYFHLQVGPDYVLLSKDCKDGTFIMYPEGQLADYAAIIKKARI